MGTELTIGQAVRKARGKIRLKDLAASTGLSIAFLSDVQNDRTMPSLKSLLLIAKALGVRPGMILDAVDNPGIFAIEEWRRNVLDVYLNGYPGQPVIDTKERMGKSPFAELITEKEQP